ncbi:MAG: peptidase domain-containing ABC transporter [Bacteroidota bacterium]|nr:peptidase domain-containing ABC transporter [Bacteroidota bacterium]
MRTIFFPQHDAMDCGPACLRMVLSFYGKTLSSHAIHDTLQPDRDGVSLYDIQQTAESFDLQASAYATSLDHLRHLTGPFIAHVDGNHFVVVYRVTKNKLRIADPATGLETVSLKSFASRFIQGEEVGHILMLSPGKNFRKEEGASSPNLFSMAFKAFAKYPRAVSQLLLSLVLASGIQLVLPFVAQALIDQGVSYQDLDFVHVLLAAQLVLFVSQSLVDFFRSWILLHLRSRFDFTMVSDYIIQLARLPIAFFDTRQLGDLIQRLHDFKRIESWLTNNVMTMLFAGVNLVIFGLVLTLFSGKLLVIFLLGSLLYIGWITVFMKRRASLDRRAFAIHAENQEHVIQMILGIRDLKQYRAESNHRSQWNDIQLRKFQVNEHVLRLNQWQMLGGNIINYGKDLLITYLAITMVINGQLTLGSLFAVQFILGQMASPIQEFIAFIQVQQDARLSFERAQEIYDVRREEESEEQSKLSLPSANPSLHLSNVGFAYNKNASQDEQPLSSISMDIAFGQCVAFSGPSGCGKSTLLKILAKQYIKDQGSIKVDHTELDQVSINHWRNAVSSMMQDDFIFAESIAYNIALGESHVDKERITALLQALNLGPWLQSLPLGLNSRLLAHGKSLSGGQRQRLLLARALYKESPFLLLDEPTASLDDANTHHVHQLLRERKGKSTLIIASHKPSTLALADQVFTMENGRLI